MSVYTTVGRAELATWLEPLALGALSDFAGIAAGMQNSNYFVTAGGVRRVLTVFEHLTPTQLDFYLALMAHLAARGIPCPQPVADPEGRLWRRLAGKPAALLSCLPGVDIEAASAEQCSLLGQMLAHLHLAAADFSQPLPNPCGADWRETVGRALLPQLSADERSRLTAELAFQAAQNYADLPRGVIHGDLFRDNVLWQSGQLSGVLDFYFAGEDVLLFDLAVVANDWCADAAKLSALVAGYRSVRPIGVDEAIAWPALRRAAALRFWLLRLEVRHHPRPGAVVTIKDPDYFGRILQHLSLAPDELPR
ncbi:MAG: homoserine kinase [Rhodocyclaceae bacterium]|nr:homoserine kinase [Rhodocyclaceae bacterium]